MHFFGKSSEIASVTPHVFEKHSCGYTRTPLITHETGSVHTGLSLDSLAPGGTIAPHLHSYEEGFYILEGEAILSVADRARSIGPGDYGALKVGTLHALRNKGSAPVRWLQMASPQPKPFGKERDTFFARGADAPSEGKPIDLSDLNAALLGHFDAGQIPPPGPTRPQLPGAEGVFLKWLVDAAFGAVHHRMCFIEYLPGSNIALHDHTFEESYFVLSGEIEAILDGRRYLARPGDVLWTGVGCVHSFSNTGKEPVRWLETFAPQPPAENVFRFMAEWEQRARNLEEQVR